MEHSIDDCCHREVNTVARPGQGHAGPLRSKSEKLWMIPISPGGPNVMLFHPLVSKIWAGTDQNGTFVDNNWPPSWMRHSDQTRVELELALIERKQSRRFQHNSIICQKDKKGFAEVNRLKKKVVLSGDMHCNILIRTMRSIPDVIKMTKKTMWLQIPSLQC